jgi:hypothetical protein
MLEAIRREPALVAGVVQAVLALLVAFSVPLTQEQVAAILGVSAAVLAIVVRAKVTPTK